MVLHNIVKLPALIASPGNIFIVFVRTVNYILLGSQYIAEGV